MNTFAIYFFQVKRGMQMRFIVLIMIFTLTACGFSPLYRTTNGKTTALTETILIQPIANYDGYQMENDLSALLNPTGVHVPKKYELFVTIDAPTFSEQNIQDDNFSSRERMYLTARYRLIHIQSGKVVINAVTSATGAYNIAIEPYATYTAKQKVKENLIKMLSNRIATHVISFVKKTEVTGEG